MRQPQISAAHLFPEGLNRIGQGLDLNLHLSVLVSLHLRHDLLLLLLKHLYLLVIVPHHLLLLMLEPHNVFLEVTELALQLHFEGIQARHHGWRHWHHCPWHHHHVGRCRSSIHHALIVLHPIIKLLLVMVWTPELSRMRLRQGPSFIRMPSIWVTVDNSSSLIIVGVLLLIVLVVGRRALIPVLLTVIVPPVPLIRGSLLPKLLLIPAVFVYRWGASLMVLTSLIIVLLTSIILILIEALTSAFSVILLFIPLTSTTIIVPLPTILLIVSVVLIALIISLRSRISWRLPSSGETSLLPSLLRSSSTAPLLSLIAGLLLLGAVSFLGLGLIRSTLIVLLLQVGI